MRTWKSAFTFILFGYLFLAGAISLTVQHYAKTALATVGLQDNRDLNRTAQTGSVVVQRRNDAIPTPPPALATNGSIGIGENTWDFSAPDDIPGFGPIRPADNHDELLKQAFGR